MVRSNAGIVLAALLAATAFSPDGLAAQSITSGELNGRVVDTSGQPIAQARVVAASVTTGWERLVLTPASGAFRFTQMPPGEYELFVEIIGYRPVRAVDISVRPGPVIRIPVTLTAAVPPVFRIWSERLQGWFGEPLPLSMLEFMRQNSLEGGSDNTPLRGGKATVFEGGVRVPGFVYWPGTLAPFKLDSVVTVEDILPTLADLVGFSAAPGAPFDGASQRSSLNGGVASRRPNFLVQGQEGDEAWYEFPWKLVLPAAGPPELYRVDEDPTEAADLADSEPDRVGRMLASHSLQHLKKMQQMAPTHYLVTYTFT